MPAPPVAVPASRSTFTPPDRVAVVRDVEREAAGGAADDLVVAVIAGQEVEEPGAAVDHVVARVAEDRVAVVAAEQLVVEDAPPQGLYRLERVGSFRGRFAGAEVTLDRDDWKTRSRPSRPPP